MCACVCMYVCAYVCVCVMCVCVCMCVRACAEQAATPFMLPAPILACLGGLCESDAICSTQDMFRVLTALHNTPGGSATTLAQLLTIATVEVCTHTHMHIHRRAIARAQFQT